MGRSAVNRSRVDCDKRIGRHRAAKILPKCIGRSDRSAQRSDHSRDPRRARITRSTEPCPWPLWRALVRSPECNQRGRLQMTIGQFRQMILDMAQERMRAEIYSDNLHGGVAPDSSPFSASRPRWYSRMAVARGARPRPWPWRPCRASTTPSRSQFLGFSHADRCFSIP
jgi:hypothetical protein